MNYKFNGSSITRTTVGEKDLCLTPGGTVSIADVEKNAYINELIEQKLLTEVQAPSPPKGGKGE